jgi:predicted nuclease of predicted toxin-antitoxin system
MAQERLIVDSNSYFRLAQNIHPLLCHPFGKNDLTLYIHADLNEEFRRSTRLKNKFHWVAEAKYAENRSRSISLTAAQKAEIDTTYDYLWDHVKEAFLRPYGKGPSSIDTRIVATALVLGIQVVTDDRDMIELAKEFDVKHVSSLGLMKVMLDEGRIDYEQVTMVVEQWMYDNDTPHRDWKKEFKKLFGVNAPESY